MKEKTVHGTQEWAGSNVNIQNGCEHDCKYCYAKAMAIRFRRSTDESWKTPKERPHDISKAYTKRDHRIMFPSSHDITPLNIEACIATLVKILKSGNEVLVVMKPDLACMKKLCKALSPYKQRVMFRLTIGTANNRTLRFWEPGAPTFDQRVKALIHAYEAGYWTSVSCEPMLDSNIDAVITEVRPYVTDAIWLGKANKLRQMTSLNCPGDPEAARRADELIATQSDDAVKQLYNRYQSDPLIKWKDSIKKVVGIQRPTAKGLDI